MSQLSSHEPHEHPKSEGAMLKHMRVKKRWSRAKLLNEFHKHWESVDEDYEPKSEAWLARIERDETRCDRRDLEILLKSLNSTNSERANTYLFGDRNVLMRFGEEVTPVQTVFAWGMIWMQKQPIAGKLISHLLEDRRVHELDEKELEEIFWEMVEVLRKQRHDNSSMDS